MLCVRAASLLAASVSPRLLPSCPVAAWMSLNAQETSLDTPTTPSTAHATCFCGDVSLVVNTSTPPISSSICHCETCRRLTGAPMMATVMYPRAAVTLTNSGAELSETRTSKHVRRLRCSRCSSPVLAELGGQRVGVPLSLFARPLPQGWQPQHHLWYNKRVVDVNDGNPKYLERYGSALFDDTSTRAAAESS